MYYNFIGSSDRSRTLTHDPMEKNEKAMTAWTASVGMPVVSWVFDHWSAMRQKQTNHRNVQTADQHTAQSHDRFID